MARATTRTAATRLRRSSVRARQEAEVRQPKYRFDDQGDLVPDPRAEAAIIYNPITGEVVWASHERDQRSIASITKVMTSIVALDHELDLTANRALDQILHQFLEGQVSHDSLAKHRPLRSGR